MTEHSYFHDATVWIYNNLAPLGLIFGGLIGTITWIWTEYMKRFATNSALQECKHQTVKSFQEALSAHEQREFTLEQQAHREIKDDIAALNTQVSSVDDKVDQLKNMLLQKEWHEK